MLPSFWAQVDESQNVLIQDHNNIDVLASVVNKEQAPVVQKVDSATHRIKNKLTIAGMVAVALVFTV